ncbi:MAG: PKD domain-containing protein [Methanosarcina sp.]
MFLIGNAQAVDVPAGYVSGYKLDSEGTTYVLKGDVLANTTAFSIEANNIVFDGNGHKINCGLTGPGMGILSNGNNNLTIKNVNLIHHDSSNDSHGILAKNATNTLISNCSVSSIAGSGIYVTGSAATVDGCNISSISGRSLYVIANNSCVTNCSAVSNSNYAICFSNSNNNTVSNCTGRSNSSRGIDFKTSNNNNISYCAGYSNTSDGLCFSPCTNSTIYSSIGYTNSTKNNGIFLMDSSNNTFINSTGLSRLKFGIYLYNDTKYNNFINCTGESFGKESIHQGIWFKFSSPECCGTNVYTNFTSRSVMATTCSDPDRTTCLATGDSITAGSAAGLPYGAYVHYANLTLADRGYVFYNRAIPNETSDSGRMRFLDEMAVFNPEYVTIMYGANDLKIARSQEAITEDILWMASQAKAKGATPIILLTSVRRGSEKNTTSLNQNLSAQALEAGYDVFNVYDVIDTFPNNGKYDAYNATNYVDSVHTNHEGNKLIGEALVKYIVALSSKGGLLPYANFNVSVSSGNAPLCVQFTDLSENATGYSWDFGDGTKSTLQNPEHTYSAAGNYTVTLTASNTNGADSITTEINVTSNAFPAPAGFNFLLFIMIVLYLFKKSI